MPDYKSFEGYTKVKATLSVDVNYQMRKGSASDPFFTAPPTLKAKFTVKTMQLCGPAAFEGLAAVEVASPYKAVDGFGGPTPSLDDGATARAALAFDEFVVTFK